MRFGLAGMMSDPTTALAELDRELAAAHQRLTDTRTRLATLTADPTLLAQPPARLSAERDRWQQHDGAAEHTQRRALTPKPASHGYDVALPGPGYHPTLGPSLGGPSIGR